MTCSSESWWSDDSENGPKLFPTPNMSRVMPNLIFFPQHRKNVIFCPQFFYLLKILDSGPLFGPNDKNQIWQGIETALWGPWEENLPKIIFWGQIRFGPKKLNFLPQSYRFSNFKTFFNRIFLGLNLELEKVSDHFQNPQNVRIPNIPLHLIRDFVKVS